MSHPSVTSLLRLRGRGNGGSTARSYSTTECINEGIDISKLCGRRTLFRTILATDSMAPRPSEPSLTCATTIHLHGLVPRSPTPSPTYDLPRLLRPRGGASGRPGPASVATGSRTRRCSCSRCGEVTSWAWSAAMGCVLGRSAGSGRTFARGSEERNCVVVCDGPACGSSEGSTNHGTGRDCSGTEDEEAVESVRV